MTHKLTSFTIDGPGTGNFDVWVVLDANYKNMVADIAGIDDLAFFVF
jgi:hypothetical protein